MIFAALRMTEGGNMGANFLFAMLRMTEAREFRAFGTACVLKAEMAY
jgi:hypothetical protein